MDLYVLELNRKSKCYQGKAEKVTWRLDSEWPRMEDRQAGVSERRKSVDKGTDAVTDLSLVSLLTTTFPTPPHTLWDPLLLDAHRPMHTLPRDCDVV